MCHLPPGTENRCVPGLWGGGGAAHIGASTGGRGASKGAMGDAAGGGAGWDKHPGGILGGGYDGTNTLAASPGEGGWDKHPGATPLPHPDEECESCRGKGGEG